jgi:pyruvate-formate lyase-activating enzyme
MGKIVFLKACQLECYIVQNWKMIANNESESLLDYTQGEN